MVLDDGELACARADRGLLAVPSDHLLVADPDAGCVLTEAGEVYCEDEAGTTSVRLDLPPAVDLTAAWSTLTQHGSRRRWGCVLDCSLHAHCWGHDALDAAFVDPGTTWNELVVGTHQACGVDAAGRVACTVLDDSELATRQHWIEAPPPSEPVHAVALGLYDACGLTTDGVASCWGTWPLEWGARVSASAPVGERWVDLGYWTSAACAVRSDGTVGCWGGGSIVDGAPR